MSNKNENSNRHCGTLMSRVLSSKIIFGFGFGFGFLLDKQLS